MAHAQKSAGGETARKTLARRAASGQFVYAYKVKGGAQALERITPPKDATLVIIPEGAADQQYLEASGLVERYGQVRVQDAKGRIVEPVQTTAAKVIDAEAFEPSAKARALLRGVRTAQEDLKQAGGAYELDEVRALLNGISRQAVEKRVREGALLAVPGPSNRRRFPTVQFTDDGEVVPGLREVRQALPFQNPWAVLNYLVNPDARLGGRRPIDALKAGEAAEVVEAARRLGQQGA
jgi:hypothetical protein